MDPALDARVAAAVDDLLRPVVVECVECGAPIDLSGRARLYCSPACRQTLKLVRYARATLADGRAQADPKIEDAWRMRLAHILAGGYHEAERRVPAAMRERVFERDDHKCVICGDPATEIDHIAGDANAMDNLRSTCGTCNFKMAEEQFVPVTGAAAARGTEILKRMLAPEPTHPRDDPQAGPGQAVTELANRRRLLAEHVAAVAFAERLRRDDRFREKVLTGAISWEPSRPSGRRGKAGSLRSR
jgi:hypothetical protein